MPKAERAESASQLGSEKEKDKDLDKLIEWLGDSESSTPETTYREVSLEDYKFYAGNQDTNEVKQNLIDAKRPCTVYNEVKPKIDMLVGMAAQTKHETTVIPVGMEDEPLVEVMGGTLKHFQRKIKVKRKELECFEHIAKGGRSLLHYFIDKSNPFKPVIKCNRVDGRNFWLDPDAQEYDLSDHRFLFIDKWLDEDEIKQFWPAFNTTLATQSGSDSNQPVFFNEAKDKYRIVEGWYYKLEEVVYFINPITNKDEFLKPSEYAKFVKLLAKGIDVGKEKPFVYTDELVSERSFKKQYYYMIFSGEQKLEGGPSPYRWEGFPAIFYGAYKDYDNNSWFGSITSMKDPQRTLNTNRRQLIFLLQSLPKGLLLHEAGAILNVEEYEKHSSEPNFHLEVMKGGLEKVKFVSQPKISPIYGIFDSVCVQSIKDASGAQDSLMGVQTSSREPGITVKARQETGIAVLYVLFDNFRESRFNGGRLLMSLIQQYVTEATVVRIEGEKGAKLLQINTEANPESKGFNDITTGEFDYVVSETAETMTIRAATAQMLVDFSHNQPEIIPPDIILDYVDIPFTAKQRVRDHWEAMQVAKKEEADREYELKLRELEIKDKPKTSKE